ncbi:MAG: hemerythrin domain-containing protein [Pyrinomonadaceae bacterium]
MSTQPEKLLTDDHSKLNELLDPVVAALQDGNNRQTFDRLDYFWARLALHIRAEHLHLFPALLRSIRSGKGALKERIPSVDSIGEVIGQLRDDHDYFMKELGGSIRQLRVLIANDETVESSQWVRITKTLEDVRVRLRAHNELEETEIYPLVNLILEPAKEIALNLQIKKELENLPARFVGTNTGL